ncbi:MAG TPA: zinc-dependent alcohol dehydrogenase [Chitinispirillaceae bacterium]|nr:zinc-dependent alcohol dehydrogenase [Chitinispirillaceae bacterium]
MKAVVFHGVGDIRLDDIEEPVIKEPTDAIIRITANAVCGTDLHMIRGTMGNMKEGTVLGHEAVGIIEQTGSSVRNLKPGDRVVVPSTIACGYCAYCRAGYYAQCDNANPNGKRAGTAFFGGPVETGSFNGLQAEKARIPFANVGPVKLPENITDDQALMLSDIFPTGYFGADIAEIKPGDTVAVFGCGPVGQFAILGAKIHGAGRIIAVDQIPERLSMAQEQGAEIVNFNEEDPVEIIMQLTGGIGVDRIIDAVGVDAQKPDSGPAKAKSDMLEKEFRYEMSQIVPKPNPQGENWIPGNAPSQALIWEVDALDKAGTLAIVGVYPQTLQYFPIGKAMNKNLTINMGNCNHRKYLPMLIDLVESGAVDPLKILTRVKPMSSAIDALKEFDARRDGWIKVELVPGI